MAIAKFSTGEIDIFHVGLRDLGILFRTCVFVGFGRWVWGAVVPNFQIFAQ